MPDIKENIESIFHNLGKEPVPECVEKIYDYILLLDKWNKAYNLTAVRKKHEMLEKHITDSLSIEKYIKGENWIDVGTGPGLPGIPLAILNPEKPVTLLDSNSKKTRFLQHAKNTLALDNVSVVQERVENYQPEKPFDAVISRAFASLADMLGGCEHFCAQNGHFYAMKGQYPQSELQEIKKPYKVLPITWQGMQFERHLIIISQASRGSQWPES